MGRLFSVIACIMWVYFGYKDRDWPRMIMELMYLIFSMRAMYNWLVICIILLVFVMVTNIHVEYVQKLYNMVQRNTTVDHKFYCIYRP